MFGPFEILLALGCLSVPLAIAAVLLAVHQASQARNRSRDTEAAVAELSQEVAELRALVTGRSAGQAETRPGQATTRPGQATTRPGQAATRPPEKTTRPSETTTRPPEATTPPPEATTRPTPAPSMSAPSTPSTPSHAEPSEVAGAAAAAETGPGSATDAGSGLGGGLSDVIDRPSWNLEESLGARLPVWIGSVALALAGAFLVKYTIDQGLLSPTVRVALGVLFATLLIGGAERVRAASDRIAAGLSASGIAVFFASFLAATDAYGLLPSQLGFVLMGLTAFAGIALSLRHGPIIAVVGLAGGFLTPALIGAEGPPSATGLFGYLLLLQFGVLLVALRRSWPLLAGAGLLLSFLWFVSFVFSSFAASHVLALVLFAFATAILIPVFGRLWGDEAGPMFQTVGILAMALGLVMVAVTAVQHQFQPIEWTFLVLITLAAFVVAGWEPDYAKVAWFCAAGIAVMLIVWDPADAAEYRELLDTTIVVSLILAAAAFAMLRYGEKPVGWASLAALIPLVYGGAAYIALEPSELTPPWGLFALVAGALYVGASTVLAERRQQLADGDQVLGVVAAGATAYISLAVPLELAREWLTVAWALEVPALLWLAGRFDVPSLRRIGTLLAALVALRLVAVPVVLSYPVGETRVFNALLYAYGLSGGAMAVAAWLALKHGWSELADGLQTAVVAVGFVFLGLQIHHWFHPADFGTWDVGRSEFAAATIGWLLYTSLVARWGHSRGLRATEGAGEAGTLLTMAIAVLGLTVTFNPLFDAEGVGATPVLNRLLVAYGLPAVLLLVAGRERVAAGAPRGIRNALAAAGTYLLFLLVTLEVRHLFHPTDMSLEETVGTAEQYAYSLAWVLFGTALLVAGIGGAGRLARYASLAVMLLAVVKVFLYDMSALTDLYRVFSFLGLGLSLLVLAYVYQRFVFRDAPDRAAPDPAATDAAATDPAATDPAATDAAATDAEGD